MQSRWLCSDCGREWLDISQTASGANPWHSDEGCPVCSSPSITERKYQPDFPGGDIPRATAPKVVPQEQPRETVLQFIQRPALALQLDPEEDRLSGFE
jgi:hypothetical protein